MSLTVQEKEREFGGGNEKTKNKGSGVINKEIVFRSCRFFNTALITNVI